jgi:predicted nicotinamide N-methyase
MSSAAFDPAAFILSQTHVSTSPVLPEIHLHLARDEHAIFQAAHEAFGDGPSQHPFWAFAWPGGQVLARYILDHPDIVAGRRVLDLGCGSGLGAVAAARTGAQVVIANDIDPVACVAAAMNARLNGVEIVTSSADLLGGPADADVVLIGDTYYLPELQMRVAGFMETARRAGAVLLFGDRTTMKRPPLDFHIVVEREASVAPMLHSEHIERARVWRCG